MILVMTTFVPRCFSADRPDAVPVRATLGMAADAPGRAEAAPAEASAASRPVRMPLDQTTNG
jgi:hypothetical protein